MKKLEKWLPYVFVLFLALAGARFGEAHDAGCMTVDQYQAQEIVRQIDREAELRRERQRQVRAAAGLPY